jgi:hypothetical protein
MYCPIVYINNNDMKTKLYTSIFLLMSVFNALTQPSSNPIANSSSDLPDGVSSDWYNNASLVIRQMEYAFYKVNDNTHFRVANSANRLGFQVSSTGYTVQPIQYKPGQPVWNIGFKLLGIGRNSNLSLSTAFVAVTNHNKITYQSPAADIEYVNEPQGLRQNFIVKQRPAGSSPLEIVIQLESELTPVLVTSNKLAMHSAGNERDIKLFYEDLKVWDASMQPLNARMELDKLSNSISIIVDDKNAVYPVTVDPLSKTADWTTSADGVLPGLLTSLQLQVQTLYGYTVAGLGDINGDTYDDVAVSAPGMADVVTGTGSLSGVGAVFVYLGSPTGLPTTPSKILQPTTAVAGALFGHSIDAGDVTGDGRNDIIIGAPLDRYQTSAGGLLGDVNVNVTAGKVYLYRSEDLLNASNPTPFLQLRLQGSDFFNTIIDNVTVNGLFGYSVAVTEDLNGDSKADIVIGSPAYQGIELLSVKNGAAFVYYSNDLSTTAPVQLNLPSPSLLGIPLFPLINSSGLLFGYSVDGVGDYNMDGKPDVVVGAPAGVDLSSLGGIFNGQVLGGSAYVYYGNAAGTGINTAIGAKLQAISSGLLGNAANLFGYKVKAVRSTTGVRNGNILVGAPAGSVLSNVTNGLRVKAGEVHVFVKSNTLPASPSTAIASTQVISSPRSSSILSILAGQTINVSLLYGASIDNMLDVNCDGISDIIVGEPLSTAVPLIGANVTGGSAYVYLGQFNGTYIPAPFWELTTTVSPLLGVNTTALIGYSVAGAKYVRGRSQGVRALVGGPSNSLDFGTGLLNLGNTLGTTLDFTFDNNGLGKAYTFSFVSCNITLPTQLVEFKGQKKDKTVLLNWTTVAEENVSHYELQRSTDGTKFETIALVFSIGGQRNEYNYTDRRPYFGMNHYRLRIVDKDGQFRYSPVVTARFDEQLPGDVVVTPNPVVSNTIRVRMTGLEKGTYHMELHNTAGQLLQSKTMKINQYDQTETMMRPANSPSGVYWLSVYDNTHTRVKTVRVFMNNE